MCGRFTQQRPAQEVTETFLVNGVPDWQPRFNVAPTQAVLTIRAGADGRACVPMKWGLVRSWAAEAKGGAKLINARSETVAKTPAFRSAFKSRRCLVPADGFYEWTQVGRTKQPHYFSLRDGRLFAFAGL